MIGTDSVAGLGAMLSGALTDGARDSWLVDLLASSWAITAAYSRSNSACRLSRFSASVLLSKELIEATAGLGASIGLPAKLLALLKALLLRPLKGALIHDLWLYAGESGSKFLCGYSCLTISISYFGSFSTNP